ncbi:MAG: DNA repair protein RecN, partial [Clostridiales bacterium]|nr:DNA repair protein RecN [Clostridiales bacterium]
GISGKAAQKVGRKLAEIAANRQVLCVTHLAQIAIMADVHMLIEKNVVGDRTYTEVSPLDFNSRQYEIARIMAGDNHTELMLKNARELLISVRKDNKEEGLEK